MYSSQSNLVLRWVLRNLEETNRSVATVSSTIGIQIGFLIVTTPPGPRLPTACVLKQSNLFKLAPHSLLSLSDIYAHGEPGGRTASPFGPIVFLRSSAPQMSACVNRNRHPSEFGSLVINDRTKWSSALGIELIQLQSRLMNRATNLRVAIFSRPFYFFYSSNLVSVSVRLHSLCKAIAWFRLRKFAAFIQRSSLVSKESARNSLSS